MKQRNKVTPSHTTYHKIHAEYLHTTSYNHTELYETKISIVFSLELKLDYSTPLYLAYYEIIIS